MGSRITASGMPLDDSSEKFDTVFDSLPDAIIIVGSDGRIVFANRQVDTLFGYQHEELAGKLVEKLVPDRLSAVHAGHRTNFFNDPSTRPMGKHGELWGKHKDGSEFPIEISLSPFEDKNGLLACASIRDVSERRRTEARQRWQTDFSAGVINALPGVFYLFDLSGRMLQWNKSLEDITGYSGEEISRMHPLEFFNETDQPSLRHAIDKAFRTGRTTVEARLRGKSGTVGDFHFIGHRIRLGDEHFLTGLGIDITDRVRAESTLEYVSGLQRILVDTSKDFVGSDSAQADELINKTLGRIGAYCEVDRSYLFQFKSNRQLMSNTHEWCAAGITPEIENLQNLPREAVPMVVQLMENKQVMHVPCISELGPDWAKDRAVFEEEDIESLILAPIMLEGEPYGFIGLDSVRRRRTWSNQEIWLLQVLCEIIGAVVKRDRSDQALRDAELLRSRAEELANLGGWEWHIADDVFRASRQWQRISGLYDEHLDREQVFALFHRDDLPEVYSRLEHTLQTGHPFDIEHRGHRADTGEMRWIKVHAELDGEPESASRLYGYSQDITERKLIEEKIAESEARYRSVVDHVHEVVFRTDEKGRWLFLNPAWEEITGHKIDDSLGRPFYEFIQSSDRASSERAFSSLMLGNRAVTKIELGFLSRQGRLRWLEANLRITRNHDKAVSGCTGTLRDITQQREAERRLHHMAHHDSVTDLPNRVLAIDRLNQLLKASHRTGDQTAVLFLDLDHFKKVNDNFGHEAGDELLNEAGRRLLENVREQDTVARFGGDEFLILLGGLRNAVDVQRITENLLQIFWSPFYLRDRELMLTASIGIAIAPTDGDNAQDLIRNADIAMYESKTQGRNIYYFFTETMNHNVKRRLSIEENLRGALERNEIKLELQPIIDLANDRIVAGEALVRWHNPALGNVDPDEFISIAEQTGLIGSLGDFVLDRALQEAADCRLLNPNFRVSVNVSPQQFRDPEFARRVNEMLQSRNLPAQALQVEITESVLLDGSAQTRTILSELHGLGVSIAMDDFGTGYASLSYLRRFPFDVLKIDRSFVSGISNDNRDRDLVIACLALAQSMQLVVVAEGVETADQLAILREHGCNLAQGFLYGRPVDSSTFKKQLRP